MGLPWELVPRKRGLRIRTRASLQEWQSTQVEKPHMAGLGPVQFRAKLLPNRSAGARFTKTQDLQLRNDALRTCTAIARNHDLQEERQVGERADAGALSFSFLSLLPCPSFILTCTRFFKVSSRRCDSWSLSRLLTLPSVHITSRSSSLLSTSFTFCEKTP